LAVFNIRQHHTDFISTQSIQLYIDLDGFRATKAITISYILKQVTIVPGRKKKKYVNELDRRAAIYEKIQNMRHRIKYAESKYLKIAAA